MTRLTFETHWPSRSINVGLQAPAANTILSAKYCVPSVVSTPTQVTPSAANSGRLNAPALKDKFSKTNDFDCVVQFPVRTRQIQT